MTEKKIYDVPKLEILYLDNVDVIATSGTVIPDDDGYSEYYPDPILP